MIILFFAMRGAITRAAGKANKFVFVRIKMGKRRGREFRHGARENKGWEIVICPGHV